MSVLKRKKETVSRTALGFYLMVIVDFALIM